MSPRDFVVKFCKQKNVDLAELRSSCRHNWLVKVRREISRRLRARGYGFADIGRAIGRSHASVMHLVASKGYCKCGRAAHAGNRCTTCRAKDRAENYTKSRRDMRISGVAPGTLDRIDEEMRNGERCRCGLMMPCYSCVPSISEQAQRGPWEFSK